MIDVLNVKVVLNVFIEDKICVMYVCLCIGDMVVMIQDVSEEYFVVLVWLYVYLEDVDKIYELVLSKGVVLV